MDESKPTLYTHVPHPHQPVNVALLHKAEIVESAANKKIAVAMTRLFSAMTTFWVVVTLLVGWMILNATLLHFDPPPWSLLLAIGSLIQLPLMIVIMVGQGLLGRKQELQAEEAYQTTLRTYHDTEQESNHLSEQDAELLKQSHMIEHVLAKLDEQEVLLKAMPKARRRTKASEQQ